jgi:uncharacterized protein (DUF305 family)
MRIVLAIGILVLATASFAPGASSSTPADPTVARLSSLSGNAFDVAFLQALIPVDDEAIEMAMTATLYGDHTELLRWNQSVVERKNGQIRKMIAWLTEAGARPSERKAGVATASVKKLRTLRGAALERAYLSLMASQLDHAVTLERLAAQKAHREALRSFAKEDVRMETQDSTMLRGWMKKWF